MFINTIVHGILLGGLYAIVALGLSLVFGVMRLVNLAHGTLIVGGGYLANVVVGWLGLDPLVALLIVCPTMFAFGYALQRKKGRPPFALENLTVFEVDACHLLALVGGAGVRVDVYGSDGARFQVRNQLVSLPADLVGLAVPSFSVSPSISSPTRVASVRSSSESASEGLRTAN